MIAKQHSARSFAAVSDYLLHDKQARTDKRVAWMEADNIWSDNPRRAARQMARTFDEATRLKSEAGLAATGRRVVSPVFHFSLSWAQDEAPTREHMADQARDVLKKLGLDKHQALIVCHDDEPHPHVHILVSRIHPETGRANNLPHSKRKLQDWALAYERAQGKIRCKLREENAKKLERGEKPRYDDPVIRGAWERSDTGKAFQAALAERGYTLAMGNKRIVVVDVYGKAINPARELHGVRAAQIKARLADIDLASLPRASDVQKQRKDEQRRGDQERAALREKAREDERLDARGGASGDEDGRTVGEGKGGGRGADAGVSSGAPEREAVPGAQGKAPPVTDTTNPEKAPEEGARTATPVKEKPAPVFDRERYQIEWEKALVEEAIRADQERLAREREEKVSGGRDDSARGFVRTKARTPEQEKAAFEEWANRKRAELQSLRLDDEGALGTRHARAREALARRLEEQYGAAQKADAALAREVEARIARGGLFYRLSGQEERDRALSFALSRNREDRERRIQEERGRLEVPAICERADLRRSHEKRAAALERRIEQAFARREAEGWRPLSERPANDQPPTRDEERARENEREREREQESPEERQRRLDREWERIQQRREQARNRNRDMER